MPGARAAGGRPRRSGQEPRAAAPAPPRPPSSCASRATEAARRAEAASRAARARAAPAAATRACPRPRSACARVFSADIPENIMERPARAASGPCTAASRSSSRVAPATREPVLRVVGVGGAGVNAVNRMIEAQVEGVEFIAVNTDLQSLEQSAAHDARAHRQRRHARPRLGRRTPSSAASRRIEQYDELKGLLKGADMVFITAGAGGGTGTGAAPVVARISREVGALTVGIVTKPFAFEGARRGAQADAGRRGAGGRGGHAHHDPELAPALGARQADLDGRGLPRGRRRAAPGRAGHLRPDHAARA